MTEDTDKTVSKSTYTKGPVRLNLLQTCRLLRVGRKAIGRLEAAGHLTNVSKAAPRAGKASGGGYAYDFTQVEAIRTGVANGTLNMAKFRGQKGGWRRPDITAKANALKQANAKIASLEGKLDLILARMGGPVQGV